MIYVSRRGRVGIAPLKRARVSFRKVVKKDPCSYCGNRRGGTIDHIEPKVFDGQSGFENETGACPDCNVAKGHLSLLHYLLERLAPQDA